ncbi:hypothetical protein OF83DRAFT_1285837 [Amylostereum chailletii]|nr:hypothetical protein OF83DRAFT_1285837 [Amylostereum chailletii]
MDWDVGGGRGSDGSPSTKCSTFNVQDVSPSPISSIHRGCTIYRHHSPATRTPSTPTHPSRNACTPVNAHPCNTNAPITLNRVRTPAALNGPCLSTAPHDARAPRNTGSLRARSYLPSQTHSHHFGGKTPTKDLRQHFESPISPASPSIRDVRSSILTRASLRRVNRWFKTLIATYHPADVVFTTTRNIHKLQRDIDLSKDSATSDDAFLVPASVRHMICEIGGSRGQGEIGKPYFEALSSIVLSLPNLSSFTTLQAHSSLYFPEQESWFLFPRMTHLPHIRKLDIGGAPWCHAMFNGFLRAATNIETLAVHGSPHLLQRLYPVNLSVDGPLLFENHMPPALRRLRLHLAPSAVNDWKVFVKSGASSLTHLCVVTHETNVTWTDGVLFPGHLLPNLTHFALKGLHAFHPPPSVLAIPAETKHATATEILDVLAAMMQTPPGELKTIRLASNGITGIVRERVRAATDGVLSLRSGHLSEAECTVDDAPGWCLQREDVEV